MIPSKIISSRLFGLLLALGLFTLPFAFAYASTSVSIQSLSPGNSVVLGNTVSFSVAASGFTSPTYSVSDSFSNSSASNNNINSSGVFSWMPSSNDVGTHTFTITVSDSTGNSTSLQEQIIVNAAQNVVTAPVAVTIQGLSPGTAVVVGNPLTFTAAATSFSNPSFTVSDSFVGSSISNADINQAGNFSWVPTANQVGTHIIMVYATDSSGHNANFTETIVVQNPNITVTSISPSTNINPSNTLTFTLSQAGFVNPSYTVSDSFTGTTISNSNINTSGYFTWTPTISQVGTHPLIIYANDSQGHSASTSIELYVIQSVSVALTAPSPSATIAPGTTVVFNADAFGFTNPAYTLADSFPGTSITNSDINSAGNFSWTPTSNDMGTHTITVSASDIYSHLSSAAATITVSGTAVQSTSTNTPTTSGLSQTQVQAILSLLTSFGADQSIINSVSAALGSGTVSGTGGGYTFNNFLGVGSTGTDVTELQKQLTTLGIYSGPITGTFGSLTQAAVKAFQSAHGITQAGYVGPATRAALNQ
jgi:hypothetical protein